MSDLPHNLEPPLNEGPLVDGLPAQSWSGYHIRVADRLNALPEQLLRLQTGVVDGSDAAVGRVGEYVTATSAPITLTSGAGANIVTLPLTAGDWDVAGNVITVPGGTTTTSLIVAGISEVAASLTPPAGGSYVQDSAAIAANKAMAVATGRRRVSLAAAGNAYLVAQVLFTGGGMQAYGFLGARRAR